jgi:pimeloyl-ACP methyl ester carboxylesterase
MNEITHRVIDTNGIRMHIAEQGKGPLVLLCHGFPESWYSWRHQLKALAEAGYHTVAADMRGYGQTDRPEEIEKYTLLHLVGDMVGVLDALGVEQAVFAGHDWGAPGGVARGASAAGPFPRRDRSERAVSTAISGAPDDSHAANRRCILLPTILPDPWRGRGRV